MSLLRTLKDTQTGADIQITPQRQLKTSEVIRLVGATFTGTVIDPNFWTAAVAASGTNTLAGGQVTSTTGTTANASATLTSVRTARYISTGPLFYRGVHRLPDAGATNNTRRWGAFDDTDGAFFQLSGTAFSIGTRKSGADTLVASTSFNGTAFTLDTNAHSYEIHWTTTRVFFYIDSNLVHTASFPTTTWTSNYSLKCRVSNTNASGATANVSIETRSMAIARFGPALTRPQYYNFANINETRVLKQGPGTLHRIVANDPATTGTITLYDNTVGSGIIIATINAAKFNNASDVEYELDFYNGLTYTSTGTPGNFTFIYE